MANIQAFLIENGYVVSEMLREIHQYHLDDRPSLRSCNMVVDRVTNHLPPLAQKAANASDFSKFYGRTPREIPSFISASGKPVFQDGSEGDPLDEPTWRIDRSFDGSKQVQISKKK